MNELILGVASALWLGILTSISPCPLATNIAAISYIGRQVTSIRYVIAAGLLYVLGRTIAYLSLGYAMVELTLSVPEVSLFLQKYMNLCVGPMLIILGMFLLNLLQVNLGFGVPAWLRQRVDKLGIAGAFFLGILFALAFCPTSAALFFGNVMASIKAGSSLLLPGLYGIGTALPVMAFALLLAVGSQKMGTAFQAVGTLERWARTVTGLVILLAGIWLTLRVLITS